MPTTIIGPTDNPIPYATYPALIQTKAAWGDEWTDRPELELQEMSVHAGSHDLDACKLKHRYGYLRFPGDTAWKTEPRLTLDGYWVRVGLYDGATYQPCWIGRIYNDPRTIYGAPELATGHQVFQAYGPQMLLRKRAVSESIWTVPTGASFVGGINRVQWNAPMNDRIGHHGWVVGNESNDVDGTSGKFVFGGTGTWSAYDFVDYLLYFFMTETDGPQWTLGGQASILTDLNVCQKWPESITVDRMLQTLISPKYGLDYKITTTDAGFEITVYSLQSDDFTAGGVTIDGNPNVVQVEAGTSPANVSTTVTRNSDHQFGTIRVLGKRIVVCCSLSGPDNDGDPINASLMPAWASSLETDYKSGTTPVPSGDAADQYPAGSDERADYCRRQDRYKDVYQLYLMPPAFPLKTLKALYMTDASGTLATTTGDANDPPWQNRLRKTLSWIPLKVGWDYTQTPPVNNFPIEDDVNYVPQFLPPAVWLYSQDNGYVPAESVHVSVSAPKVGLGVRLHCEPHHRVETTSEIENTIDPPEYTMAGSYATVAFESDCRLMVSHTLTDTLPGVDGVRDIEVGDAELWVLSPKTVLAVKSTDAGQLDVSSDDPVILRNDVARLSLILAGATARYADERVRAVIVCKGLYPWGSILGNILTVIDTGDAGEHIDTPITSITWTVSENDVQTVISTGFARG